MKKTLFIAVIVVGFAAGAFAQGAIGLATPGRPPHPAVDIDALDNPYTGTFGIEVWGLNAAAVPPGINLDPSPGSGVAGYDAMRADGFSLQGTFVGQWMSSGRFFMSTVILPTIPGPEAVLALAIWNTSAPSWDAMQAAADSDTRAGVIAFVNPVSVLAPLPLVPAPLTGWTEDLVMTTIPEPSALTLAALGGALLLFARFRGRCTEHTSDDLQPLD